MDEVERRIRRARPLSGHRDLPLTDRAKRELGELILAEGAQRTARRAARLERRRAWLLAPAAASAVVVVAVIVGAIVARPAEDPVAFTPMPLTTEAAEDAPGPLLDVSDDVFSDAVDGSFAYRTWALDGSASPDVIAPRVHTVRIAEDGTRTETVTTAQPTAAPDADADSAPPAGTVLSERRWTPGAFASPHPEPLPDDASRIGSYLESVVGTDSSVTGSEVLRAIEDLLVVERLTTAQTLALVSYLTGLTDVAVAGTVVDREGRDGIAFAATKPDDRGETPSLIFSPDGKRVLDFEVVYEGSSRDDLQAPAVVAYTVWLDDTRDE